MSSKLSDIIRTIDLEPATEVIRQAYHDQGYTGEFGSTAEFRFVNDRIELSFSRQITLVLCYTEEAPERCRQRKQLKAGCNVTT